ncbi:MAG: DUF4097 family beta strand repeat-containing protein [Hespellia sp.]|nr:DUF4097 family beta strand repeat-containing protein [Hespellia sp.]
MKKGWKIFWIMCASIAGFGLILFLAGIALGADGSLFAKAYEDSIRKTVQVTTDWDDYYEDHSGDTEHDSSDSGVKQEPQTGEQVRSYKDIKKLSVDVNACEVVIRQSTDSEVKVDASNVSSRLNLQIRNSGDELEIESNVKIPGNKSCGTLVIYIPKGYEFEKADFTIGAGVLSVEAIQAKELDIEVGAGEATVKSCKADELSADCGAGQMTVNVVGSENDYDYDIQCGIGEINIGGGKYSGLGVDQYMDNDAAREMDIQCGVGQVYITFTDTM